jgi:hypothetical protein
MAVTVDASSIVGGGSGLTGWSAKSTFYVPGTDEQNLTSSFESHHRDTLAQSFTTGPAQTLKEVWTKLARSGSPTDNHWIEIYADSGDTPTGSLLATSSILDPSTVVAHASSAWYRFTFASPPTLAATTKYWIRAQRTTWDASHFLYWYVGDGNPYAGGVLKEFSGGSWTTPGANYDFMFITVMGERLYQVTQDAELHVWESTDNGTSWTELDAGNGPAVNSSTKPFSADARGDSLATTAFSDITCVLFTNTNTIRGWDFNLNTRLWDTTALQNADASTDADFNRNVRVIARPDETVLFYTSVADDADLEYVRRTTGVWGSQTQTLVINSTESSCYSDVIKDGGGFAQMFWYDAADDDYELRSLTGTTLGTELDIDTTAADVETEHASANYAVYDVGGTDTVIAAYIDADGSIQERVLSMEVTSASVSQGTEHAVGTATTTLGRSLATCKANGNLYIFAGLSGGIDYYVDIGATGTWSAATNWKTGLTNAVLSTAVPITGVGILVSYVDNGNVVVELLTFAATVNGSLATATGAALSALIKPTIQGSLSTGSGAALAGAATFDILGSIAAATGAALDGTVLAPQTVEGSLSTATGAALDGTLIIDIPGALATGSGAANSGALIAAMAGSVAAADGAAYSGALKFTYAGSLATAAAQANDGAIVVDIVGSTALADAVANDGQALIGFTVLGSLATATAQANDGSASETGAGDDEPRSGFFQLRPLVAEEA